MEDIGARRIYTLPCMAGITKDKQTKPNQRFDRLVSIRRVGQERPHYWVFRCDCGEEIERIPSKLRDNVTINCCNTCRSGANHINWKGAGELGARLVTATKHGALKRGLEFSVTAEYLWSLFLEQDGRCALSGMPLDIKWGEPRTASIDRIDSTKGYVEGNLQWVHTTVNKLKKNIPDDQFIQICMAVSQHQNLD